MLLINLFDSGVDLLHVCLFVFNTVAQEVGQVVHWPDGLIPGSSGPGILGVKILNPNPSPVGALLEMLKMSIAV